MNRYFEINENNLNIRCKIYFSSLPAVRRAIVFGHGFAGHKDNKAAEKFADRVLSKYKDVAVFTFNWPCHGDDVKKKLILSDCTTYLSLVVKAVREQYGANELYGYATSFGGYLFLKYIAESGNPFRRISLRCPAVNMYSVLTDAIMKPEEQEKIRRGKEVMVGFDRKIAVNPQFLEDVKEKDIRQYDFLDFADDILILHGTKDEVVPFEEAKAFAENNVIEFVPVEDADHRFQNSLKMDAALKAILDFFQF